MSGQADDWSDLRHMWQSGPALDALELERAWADIALARRTAALRTALDMVACLLGFVIGTWSLLGGTGTGTVVGLAAYAFSAFGGWLTWRSARQRGSVMTGTVVDALEAAIAVERSAEEHARAVLPTVVAAAAFLGVLGLATSWDSDAGPAELRRMLAGIGLALVGMTTGALFAHRRAQRHRRRRRLLEQRRRELET